MNKIIMSPKGEINNINDAVIKSRETGIKSIYIKEGYYEAQNASLTNEDNGLTIEGSIRQPAVLSGSIEVAGFELDNRTGFLFKKLPDDKSYDFRMICANGKYLKKARYPQKEKLYHETIWDVKWTSTFGNGWERQPTEQELTTFVFKQGDICENFSYKNAEIVIFHEWDESSAGVKAIDYNTRKITLSSVCGHPPGSFDNQAYVVYNTIEGMKEPLNWYFDKDSKNLYIYPDEGMTAENLKVMLPLHYSIIKMDNTKDITIKNLHFEGCTTPLIVAEFGAQKVCGSIDGQNVDNVIISNVTVERSGGTGVRFTGVNIKVMNSCFNELGACGVWIGINDEYLLVAYEDQERGASSEIINCTINKIGLDYFASIGVFGRHTNIIGNYIRFTPYMGINAGGDGVLVKDNYISDVMCKLNDGAAIYTIGYSNGIISSNVINNIKKSQRLDSKKSAIYLDENSGGWLVEDNIINECDYPIFCHMCMPNNIIRNNTCICNKAEKMNIICLRSNELSFEGNIFKTNGDVLFHTTENCLKRIYNNVIITIDGNVKQIEYDLYLPINEMNLDLEITNIVRK